MTTVTESGGRQNMYPAETRSYIDESISYEIVSSMYGLVSVGYIFWRPPLSVTVVIEILIYVTILYIKD